MSKKFAILGDIHANIDALNVVMDDARSQGVTDFLCTGDVVGYNAAPSECLKIIRDLGCPVVKGNHDHYVSSVQNLNDFHPDAAAVVAWTCGHLSDDEMDWLRRMPFTAVRTGITLVHATMDEPEHFGYVFYSQETAKSDLKKAELNFIHQKTPLCFNGHTHVPVIFEKQLSRTCVILPEDVPEGFTLTTGRRYFVNVGSVGQPRDGDPRAAYAIYDVATRTVRFRRLAYDIAAAQARVRAAGLPERLALRLEKGL